MKRVIQLLFLLGFVSFSLDVFAQEQPSATKFPIGSFIGAGHDTDQAVYRTRFNMALDYTPETVNPNENVCVIKVKYRYAEVLKFYNPPKDTFILHDTVFVQDTLKISDFNEDGLFKYFELPTYAYPSKFGYGPVPEKVQIYNDEVDTFYTDSNGDNGIQFCVDWLRDNNLGNFID
ncbi:MAG: hypothetical protein IPH11_16590 [Ignavibacteriales bacterium]|nr:hypothetical protein [Ignavibacteriales bacterium]